MYRSIRGSDTQASGKCGYRYSSQLLWVISEALSILLAYERMETLLYHFAG